MNETIYGFIYWGTIAVVVGSIIVLSITAFIVRDLKFIQENFWVFFVETLIIGFLMGAIILVMGYLRDLPYETQKVVFVTLAIKIMILHVLFQISGVYSVGFKTTSPTAPTKSKKYQ